MKILKQGPGIKNILVVVASAFLLSACGGSQKVKPRFYDVDAGTPAGQALEAWLAGDEEAAAKILETPSTTPEHAFIAAEIAYGEGDVEDAFNRYGYVVSKFPDHAFARYAAARLYTLRDTVRDFPERAAAVLDAIDTTKLDPLARTYIAMAEQAVIFRTWDRSDNAAPFEGSAIGFPDRWNITPSFSPFRLTAFDAEYPPQKSASLSPEYLSPVFAVDDPRNYEKIQPYFPAGLSLAPPTKRDGVHYLETFATVTQERDLWIYGNFSGRTQVLIDGEVVLDRAEDDYQTGKRLRKIRLSPGTHRLLVKLAVQRGYRDWFDLQFIPAGPVTRTGLVFESGCLADRMISPCHEGGASKDAEVEMLSDAVMPSALEPVFVPTENIAESGDLSLYLTMLGAYFSAEDAVFDQVWEALAKRRPNFAAGHALRSQQVQTLWQWPSRLRDATSLQELREALRLQPTSTIYTHLLAQRIKGSASDREIRELTESAAKTAVVDGRVRLLPALEAWSKYLEDLGYDEAAEKEWRNVQSLSPGDCDAGRAIQRFEQARNVFSAPEDLVKDPGSCPAVIEAYQSARSDRDEANLAHYKKYAGRFPYSADPQVRYANELVKLGRIDEAKAHIEETLKRIPDAANAISWKVDRAFADDGVESALKILAAAEPVVGSTAWVVWKRALLKQEIPLMTTMPDGYKAAMEAVKASKTKALSTDDAYYVIDFAARQYFPDGANITLTHTVVRVLTKNAIDRFAETQVPSDARILVVRTIKQDGTVQVPEETAGKQTLSMSGLAEGDFVELAFIQFNDSPYPESSRDGVRFFFRMEDISTLHSEFVILGDRADFILQNNPPKPQDIQIGDLKGVRFLATDNPRPREERYSVGVEEYLPWIQMHRNGLAIERTEGLRRVRYEQLVDSSKPSTAFKAQARRWIEAAGEASELDRAKSLFYAVSAWIPEPSLGDLTTDVSHAVLTREGNSMTLLRAVLNEAGIKNDLYFIRSPYAAPEKLPTREAGNFNTPILRVEVDGEGHWLSPSGPDAMFGAVEQQNFGQELMCVTCKSAADGVARLPMTGFPDNAENVVIKAQLDDKGDLAGTLQVILKGAAAEPLRAGLRARADDANREKLMGAIAAQLVSGSTVQSYEIINEKAPDTTLELVMKITRSGFARPNAGGLGIETRLFDEPIARVFASLPERTVPMMIGYARQGEQHMELSFPRKPKVLSLSGTRDVSSKFGSFKRSVSVEGNTLILDNTGTLPIQRVPVDAYPAFQKWAVDVEQNSPFVVVY